MTNCRCFEDGTVALSSRARGPSADQGVRPTELIYLMFEWYFWDFEMYKLKSPDFHRGMVRCERILVDDIRR